jgi:hypothetical protein
MIHWLPSDLEMLSARHRTFSSQHVGGPCFSGWRRRRWPVFNGINFVVSDFRSTECRLTPA